MKKPLINDDLKVLDWQLASFSKNVVRSTDIISQYPQLSSDQLHHIDRLEFMIRNDESVLYKFDGIVLKYVTTDNKDVVEAFYREIITGLHINSLNLDNFAHTVGYYISDKCSIPDVRIPRGCVYLYIKEIHGPTLMEFIPKSSLVQFKDVMIKLLDAYKIAHEELDFCHYYLHFKNVIISSKGDELIPVIIDFGASHIKLKDGTNIGEYWPEQGRYNGTALWVYDLFKIFAFSWLHSLYEHLRRETEQEVVLKQAEFNMVIEDGMSQDTESGRLIFKHLWNEEQDDWDEIEETVEQFIHRLESSTDSINTGGLGEYLRYAMPNAITLRDMKIKWLNENRFNLNEINSYCRKVLTYFNSNMKDTAYLENYMKSVSPTFGSSVTELGVKANLNDFIQYVKTL